MFPIIPDNAWLFVIAGVGLVGVGIPAALLIEGDARRHWKKLLPVIAVGAWTVAVAFTSANHWGQEQQREIVARAVAANEKIFARYDAYSPSTLDLAIIDPSLEDAIEGDPEKDPVLEIETAPVAERVIITYGKASETLQGPIFDSPATDPPTSDQLAALASN